MAKIIIPKEYREAHYQGMSRYLSTGRERILNQRIEITALSAKGIVFPVELTVTSQQLNGRYFFTAFIRDISVRKHAEEALARHQTELERLVEERTAALMREVEERRRAEEALHQGEKLQALGQLTGGIAHDFNNMLQVVASGARLLKTAKVPEERRGLILDGMVQAAENAKQLVDRMLAFARRKPLRPSAFDLNARLEGMAELLRHTLGSRIQVQTDFALDLWPVMADPSQLEVAVLNLAANARDAMLPEGGTLTLRTRNAILEPTAERAGGEYVCLIVKDTGHGMPSDVLARAFEPFFTTKGPDKGTGLGLPQVHGFAKQSGGDIHIESAPGKGTTITIHFPRASAAAERTAEAGALGADDKDAPLRRAQGGTVLIVEDNPEVAASTAAMLEEIGYATHHASNAEEALAMLASGATVDAVFSDIVMPGGMNGLQLASTLRMSYPQLAVVLATGYSEALTEWKERPVAEVLSKPYQFDELAAALERALTAVGTARRKEAAWS
jgi:signal transduction histidine kinase/ActR/RegA family two-component response regulator